MEKYKAPKLKLKVQKGDTTGQKGLSDSSYKGLVNGDNKPLKFANVSDTIKLSPKPGKTTFRKASEPEFQRKDAQMETDEAAEGALDRMEGERVKRELRLKKRIEGMK